MSNRDAALMRERAIDGLRWCEDWRDGQFAPAHTDDGWTVEMYGIVGDYEDLARAYLEATTAPANPAACEHGNIGLVCPLCGSGPGASPSFHSDDAPETCAWCGETEPIVGCTEEGCGYGQA